MILLADSGSTKTTWVLLDGSEPVKTITTAGLNPYFHTEDSVAAILESGLLPEIFGKPLAEIHFYGAGCSTETKNDMLRNAIARFFPLAEINIYHDILGAARALLGKGEGIACILGTGCNACYYDGHDVASRVPSLGYMFGDEGAGSNIGKLFMEKYLKDKLPVDLRADFDRQYSFTLEQILDALYNKPYPNRFLASFSEFIAPRRHHPFLKELVSSSFNAFFEEQVEKYPEHKTVPVSFVGSIAFYYQDILKEVANARNAGIGRILRSPMEGLIEFHILHRI